MSKLSKSAKACVAREIAKHCRKKHGRKTCKRADVRKQAVAIGFSICRRKGLRSIPVKR